MNDFEVHPIGHFEEIKLARKLMNELYDYQNFDLLHPRVVAAMRDLRELYERQMEKGIQ